MNIATAPKYEKIWMLSDYLGSKRVRKSDFATFRNKKNQRKKVIFETSKIGGFYLISLATPSMTNSNNHKVKALSNKKYFGHFLSEPSLTFDILSHMD